MLVLFALLSALWLEFSLEVFFVVPIEPLRT